MFSITDEIHQGTAGDFTTLEAALGELRRLSRLPWDEPPNRPPCTLWATCGRDWELIEWEGQDASWRLIRQILVLNVSATGTRWSPGPDLTPTEADAPPPRSRGKHQR